MSRPKPVFLLAALFLAAWLAPSVSVSQESSSTNLADRPASPPRALDATIRTEERSGAERVHRAYVSFGTNRFAFIVPSGFRLDASDPGRIVLVKQDYDCFLTFRVAESLPGGIKPPKPGACRRLLGHQYPGANVQNVHSQTVDGNRGPAFDLQWTNASGTTQSVSAVFVSSGAGVLEFSLLSRPEKFSEGQYFFNSLLLSFCSNQGGKLKITRLSDKF